MSTRKFLSTLASGTLLIAAAAIAGASACGGGPGIFNVFENGKIAIDQGLNYQN